MFTADQLVAHLVGDFLLQSHWMATRKFTSWLAIVLHVVTYTAPFLLLTRSPAALAFILGSHLVIDRYRIPRYVCWARNVLFSQVWKQVFFGTDPGETSAIGELTWPNCSKTGWPSEVPDWLAGWLLIFSDQILHLLCNGAALRWL